MKDVQYFSKLRGFLSNPRRRATRRATARRSSSFQLEALEPRMLLSAALTGAVPMTDLSSTHVGTVQPAIVAPVTASTAQVGTAINIAQGKLDSGNAYRVTQNFGTAADTAAAPTASQLRIFENGVEIGPAHTAHADIRTSGDGRFSHWSDGTTASLYFSASDNSNPMTNGRTYTYLVGTATATTPTPTPTTTTPTPTPTTTPTTSPTQTTGQVYYVSPGGSDSNAGSANAPWHSIQTAAQRLKAGETAILLDGTYTEGQVQFANSGTAASPITIKAQNQWGAVLSSVSGDNPAISINQSYITIENLRISVSPNNPWSGVNNSANAAIRAWSTNTPTAANPSTGLVGATIRGVLVDYSPMHSVGIKTNQDFSLVENCEVHSSLEAFNNQGTTFRNNTIYGNDYWGDSIYGKGGVRNFQVYGNVVHMTNANGRGLFIGGNSSGWWYDPVTHYEAYNSIAHDNIVYNETGRTGVAALGLVGTLNCTLQNNTVTAGGALFQGKGSQSGLDPRPDPTNSTLINNTFA
jgi:hypothetical protein